MANALHQPDQWSPDFQSPAVVGWTPSIRVCHSNRGSPTDEVVGWTPSDRVCHSIRRSPTDEGMWICQFRGSSCSAQGPCAVSLGPKTGRSTYTEPKEYVLLQTLEHCSKTYSLVKFQGPSQSLGPRNWTKEGTLLLQWPAHQIPSRALGSHRPLDPTAAVVGWTRRAFLRSSTKVSPVQSLLNVMGARLHNSPKQNCCFGWPWRQASIAQWIELVGN